MKLARIERAGHSTRESAFIGQGNAWKKEGPLTLEGSGGRKKKSPCNEAEKVKDKSSHWGEESYHISDHPKLLGEI